MKRYIRLFITFIFCTLLCATVCFADGFLELSATTLNLAKGSTYKVEYTCAEEAGKPLKVSWSSSDDSVARVSGATVTAVGIGEADISCTIAFSDTEETAKLHVCVFTPVVKLSASEAKLTLYTGEQNEPIEISVVPDEADYQEVTWSSLDEEIATVDENGVVSAVKAGTTTITATSIEPTPNAATPKKVDIQVTVQQLATGIEQKGTKIDVGKGRTLTLNASVLPEDVTQGKLEWKTEDAKIASVANGKITGVGLGNTIITASTTDGTDISASWEVNVFTPVTNLTSSVTKISLNVGEKSDPIEYTVKPDTAEYIAVDWASSNEEIATVDDRGVVTALKAGEVKITGTSLEPLDDKTPAKTCTVAVTVLQPAMGISINDENQTLPNGKRVALEAVISPKDTSNTKVKWESGDPKVATVAANGTVTALKAGTTKITATTTDGSDLSAECVITVIQGVTGIKPSGWETVLFEGEHENLCVIITPEDATNQSVKWSSDNTRIVEVDSNGRITAKKAGKAKVTATTMDGTEKSCTFNIVVEPDVPVDVESLGFGVYNANLLGITVKNQCAKHTIKDFYFDIDLYSFNGKKISSGSYSIGDNIHLGAGGKSTIKRTLSGVSWASKIRITVTGVEFSDGSYYSVPYLSRETRTFSR